MQIAKMNAMLTATAKGFKETFAGAGKDAQTFADKMKGIKSQLGEESGLGNFAKVLKGAGAVAGVAALVSVLNNATAKAVELKNAFNEGRITIGQMTEELIKSLPILGQAWELGRNIRELATGEGAADEKAARAIERQTQERAEQVRLMLKSRDLAIDLEQKLNMLYMPEQQRQFEQLRIDAEKDIRNIRKLTVGNASRRASLVGTRMAILDTEAADLAQEIVRKQLQSIKDRFSFGKADGGADVAGGIRDFIKKTLAAGGDLIANAKANQQPLTDPGAPELLQSGSQAAASFIARMQRQQFTDPEAKQQTELAKKQTGIAEQSRELLAKISNAIGGVV